MEGSRHGANGERSAAPTLMAQEPPQASAQIHPAGRARTPRPQRELGPFLLRVLSGSLARVSQGKGRFRPEADALLRLRD